MRMLGCAALVVLTVVTLGRSEEIQRWTDAQGHVHYMNLPGGHGGGGGNADIVDHGDQATDVATHTDPRGDAEDPRNAAIPPPAQGPNGANDEQDAYSTQASLRRTTLERDLRATEKRIKEIDDQLAGLQKVRGKNAAGSEATGGVRASIEVRSEEEAHLADEREKLDKHATEVRVDYAKLREEVTSRLGSTPAWWIDVR